MIKSFWGLIFIGLFTANIFSQENIVSNFIIQGNKKVKPNFIKKLSTIKPGALLDSLVLEKDIIRLKRLPGISHAYYQVFYSHDNQYNVYYNIEENFTIIPSANIYTSNEEALAYRIGLYEFNLFGHGLIFGGFYQKDIYNSFSVNFRAPYLFNRKFGIALNYMDLTTLEPVFFDNTTADYKYNNNSFEVLGLYELDFHNHFELGVNFFTEDYEYVAGATNSSVPLSLKVDKILYKLIYKYDNLDYSYQYVSGFKSILNFQFVTSENDLNPNFVIGWNDFLYLKRLGKKGNWANRLRLGLSTNNDSPFAPFSVDNNVNIRGVGNVIDRGTGSIVLNSEFRYTVLEKGWFVLQGNAFVDSGSWRNPGGELSDFSDSDNIKVYSGLGVRFIHKKIFNAIFRIDYGVGLSNDSSRGFVFGIGQYF